MGKDKIPVAYASIVNERSMLFCDAFAKGCGGKKVTDLAMLHSGPVAGFWLPELYPILNAAQAEGRDWYYGDKAYFGRGQYWRITKNAKMHDCSGNTTPERFKQLGLTIKPWRNGSEILLCPQSDIFMRFNGTTQAAWIKETMEKIRQHTDRPIRIHLKQVGKDTERYFRRQLINAWAVVVYTSMAGAQAALEGVPCFATNPDSVSAKFGTTDLSRLEGPVKPDNREQMAWVLADNQWTFAEIAEGMAWQKLKQ